MKKILLYFLLLFPVFSHAQHYTGKVFITNDRGRLEPAVAAAVFWISEKTDGAVKGVVYTDEKGMFRIAAGNSHLLVAAYMGFAPDTLHVHEPSGNIEFILYEDAGSLQAVDILGRQRGNLISRFTPIKTEVITAAGLCKMACCNLAESFENSASVTVGYADAVTGARQIRLLGLSGNYTQMLEENRPAMRGVQAPFGFSFVPGQWLESIQIAKGTGSVINGYEAITGQINMEFRKPTAQLPFYLNLFVNDALRTEANVASALQLNDHWSTITLAHVAADLLPHDGNNDGFLDEPLTNRYQLANRWLYEHQSGAQIRFGFRGLYEDRKGGQVDAGWVLPGKAPESNRWGSRILNKGINAYLKIGIPLVSHDHDHDHDLDHEQSEAGLHDDHDHEEAELHDDHDHEHDDNHVDPNIAFVLDYNIHQQNAYFGRKEFDALQQEFFANAMFLSSVGKYHKISAGLSAHLEQLNQNLWDRWAGGGEEFFDLGRKEHAFGGFGEYTLNVDDKFVFIAGARADYNTLFGWLFTPGVNVRYDFLDEIVLRASAGRGYRSPYVITDNIGVLSTGRRLLFEGTAQLEQAWTYGVNLTFDLPFGFEDPATFSVEYFRTDFKNQLIADQEFMADAPVPAILFYNLEGRSFTNTYQADLTADIFRGFTLLATFRYNQSKVDLKGQGLVDRPLTSKYKGVLNVQYTTPSENWVFDVTGQLNGPARIPSFAATEEDAYSPVFPMFFAQVTRKINKWEIYVGGENLLNYKQPNPIISADDPFSSAFNASVIWGPLMGIRVYGGLRFTL